MLREPEGLILLFCLEVRGDNLKALNSLCVDKISIRFLGKSDASVRFRTHENHHLGSTKYLEKS